MESKFQTSFIPKKTITPISGAGGPIRRTSIFSLIAAIIFIASLVLGLAVFGYQYYLTKHNEELKTELKAELAKFEPALVADLTRLDDRIESTKTILDNHIAFSTFFTFLGNTTLKNSIRFTNFRYETRPGSNEITVRMDGLAQSFSAVALQQAEFNKPENQLFARNPIFTGLTLDEKGFVKFSFSTVVDKEAVLYKDTVLGTNIPSVPVTVSSTTPSAASTTSQ